MRIIFLDLELQNEEILEIGAVCMNITTGNVQSCFSQLCQIHGELSEEIINLTGITDDMLEHALPLKNVLQKFWTWVATQQSSDIYHWGWRDTDYVKDACIVHGIVYPRIKSMDIKLMYKTYSRLSNPSLPTRCSLENAIEREGMPFPGKPHRAVNDAKAAAMMYLTMIDSWSRRK